MSAQTVLSAAENGVLTITLNRPEVHNAFNEQMRKELLEALEAGETDDTARCIVIRGAGDRAFCSGHDLKEYSEHKHSLKEALDKGYNPVIRKLRSIEKPVIAMINGVAAGAGCSIAFACDMSVMSSSARLIQAFVRIGLIPDSGAHWFLPRMVGMARAFEFAATGRDIGADEALRVGLVNRVVAPADLQSATSELAQMLAAAPTQAIGLIKRTLNRAVSCDLESTLDLEAKHQQTAQGTRDHEEGLRAFVEKRKPRFEGR